MTFQDIIQTLNTFWGKQGCIIGQPYGVEVGAGTGNPHTFFRVLGPEPYNVAYVEPSRRPTDGRYGESPNRFQHYFQYQVILKPAPQFNQELFLESLMAIGIDPTKHDIRFVEDNWESTPLGAWGLGWEVWCDGMEVAQYTYFQQMAGTPLEVPALEITYGLERIAMYIQDITSYKELKWNETTTYADIFQRHEYWQATHNFETSSPSALQTLYTTYESEVATQLERKNFWAAYDYLLHLSHVFNLLDARGMVSLSDRIAKFGAMSRYTKAISAQYLEDRKSLGYPLLGRMKALTYQPPLENVAISTKGKYQKNIAIVELGFEEIPSDYLEEWGSAISHSWFKEQLRAYGISFRKAYIYTTPRRIVLKIVQPSKKGIVQETIKGPPLTACYDATEKPTPVLEGFLRKYGATKSQLSQEIVQGKQVVTLIRHNRKTLGEVLQAVSQQIIERAPKTKWMMWHKDIPTFIRPLRWIIAYHNRKKLPLSILSVSTGKTTLSPRYEKPIRITIESAQHYADFIRNHGIIVSASKRTRRITTDLSKTKRTPIGKYSSMITKNTYLTENPHIASVQLEKRYQILPQELITLILEKNQMYPISKDTQGGIWYSIVGNQTRIHKRIVLGNQKVAKARLEDGLFYYAQDSKNTLESFGDALSYISFHPKAGTYKDKKERIALIAQSLFAQIGSSPSQNTLRALELIKNDKATALGREFTSLEGVIGKYYALRDGEATEVANLLAEHYLPYEPDGEVPASLDATIISLADKIDSLNTLATVEKIPEGGNDPFEMRKTAYRILTILIKSTYSFSIDWKTPELKSFVTKRFQQLLEEEGIAYWIAHSVATATSNDFGAKYRYAHQLAQRATSEAETTLMLDSFKRVMNILQKNAQEPTAQKEELKTVDLTTLPEQEGALLTFVLTHANGFEAEHIPTLARILNDYFAAVMVLDPNLAVRARRIGTLALLRQLIEIHFSITFN